MALRSGKRREPTRNRGKLISPQVYFKRELELITKEHKFELRRMRYIKQKLQERFVELEEMKIKRNVEKAELAELRQLCKDGKCDPETCPSQFHNKKHTDYEPFLIYRKIETKQSNEQTSARGQPQTFRKRASSSKRQTPAPASHRQLIRQLAEQEHSAEGGKSKPKDNVERLLHARAREKIEPPTLLPYRPQHSALTTCVSTRNLGGHNDWGFMDNLRKLVFDLRDCEKRKQMELLEQRIAWLKLNGKFDPDRHKLELPKCPRAVPVQRRSLIPESLAHSFKPPS